ncbi:MAG: FKBP-type peptidyl-prolyl cis-trans isomerase [Lachnospiraceae bacterium]|nr:FKBP-type peptidyl-prolyl cis-trans isomerase [Lachnospiraceae bacterium]
MNKFLVILLSGVLTLQVLSGCGATGGNSGAPTAKSGAYLGDFDVSGYVTLGEYKDMEITLDGTQAVTDEEVDEYMQGALSGMMQKSDSDKPIEDGDTINADYSGRIAETDEVFDGGTAEGVQLTMGAGGYIEGFEEGFFGMVPGEVKEVPLTFPEDYHSEDLAGVDVIFTFTFNHHLEAAPAWTDELVAEIGLEGVSTVADLKEYTKGMLEEQNASTLANEAQSKIFETVENNCTFSDPPQEMLDRFKTQLRLNAEKSIESTGQEIDVDQMITSELSYYGFTGTADEMIAEYSDRVSKVMMMYYAVVQAEGLTINESEVQTQITSVLEANGYETVEAMNTELQTDIEKEIRETLYMSAAQEFLLHNNRAVDATGAPVEFHTHEEPAVEGGVGADGSIGGN